MSTMRYSIQGVTLFTPGLPTIGKDEITIGSWVRIRHSPKYGSPSVLDGVVLGLDVFPSGPMVTVLAFRKSSGASYSVELLNFGDKESEEYQILVNTGSNFMPDGAVVEILTNEINKAMAVLGDARRRLAQFEEAIGFARRLERERQAIEGTTE